MAEDSPPACGAFLFRADGVGAESADAAAGVPAHRDRQRRGAAGHDGGRAGLGEYRRVVVYGGLGRAAVGPARRRRGVAGPARVGEQRADDVLLLRLRPGGPPRVRHGRAAGAGPAGAAGRGRAGRAAGPGRHLPGRQRRPARGSWLGRGDVHGHGVRAGDAGPDRAPVPRPGARVPAVGGGRRRPGLAGRHRRRLQQGPRAGPAGRRGRDLRRDPGPAPGPDPVRDRLRAAGDRGVGRGPEVRRRPGGRRPGDGPADLRLPGGPDRPGTRQRPVPQLPRAADPRARPVGAAPGSPRRCPRTSGCSSSTIPGPATSSCRCSRSPTPASRSAAPSSPAPTPPRSPSGILIGYVAGQAARHHRRVLAADPAQPRPAPAARRLGRRRRASARSPGSASPCPS